jgi:hypothetical protein
MLRARCVGTGKPRQRQGLYGLDRLSGHPGAPVLVCEGEKAADAAATKFPTIACVTSMGGNKAAAMADWSPLAGRHVTIWPDHDAPGSEYAEDVARLVAPVATSVRIVPVPGHFPAKWDLADPVPDGADLAALLKIAEPWGPAAVPYIVAGPASSAKPNGHDEAGSGGVGSEDYRMSEDEFHAAISTLAAMPFGAYQRVRAGEAKRLRITVRALDTLVARKRPADEAVPGQGRPLDFPPPEPWLDR